MKFYINGKKTTKKAAQEAAGAERFKTMLADGRAAHEADPYEQIFYMVRDGVLTIEF